jgi:hypothetical protein
MIWAFNLVGIQDICVTWADLSWMMGLYDDLGIELVAIQDSCVTWADLSWMKSEPLQGSVQ